MNNRNLVILRGVSGCGKSSLAALLGDEVYSADDYLYNEDGEYVWTFSRLQKAHATCIADVGNAMERGVKIIVVDNTNVAEREIKPYTDLAEKYGYRVYSIIVENRHGGVDKHAVPVTTLEKQERRLRNSIKLR